MSRRFQGWPLVGSAALVLTLMIVGLLVQKGLDVEGARIVIRATARTSAVLFCAAFAASSLVTLRRGPTSTWLLRNRRFLGMSFGVSHTYHYLAVAAFAVLDPEQFFAAQGDAGPEKLAPILLLVLMMATSFDRTAAMLGRRAWKAVHLVGTYFFWFAFFVSFAGRALDSAFYSGWTALLVLTMAIRLAALATRFKQSRAGSVAT
ncbi:MAG: hypothetical protein JRH01_17175 [Deltaproteobacteria bacterium]|nr:hypothetical protein [Deltaproteobacteria bacterium]MBW2397130.1 hypothetical protein [Deltaproteobacteria bacterium]